jgi:uncharacterized protein YciI
MRFDEYTIALLVTGADAPELSDAEAAALQDAHMSHLADLHEAGHLLAAGPVDGGEVQGLSILAVPPEQALELKRADPAVRAGVFDVRVLRWRTPSGFVSFAPGHLPRSVDEVRGTQ